MMLIAMPRLTAFRSADKAMNIGQGVCSVVEI
jgi:hypothetical protein